MDYRKAFRVDPGAKVKLKKLDPAYMGKITIGRRGQIADRGLSQEALP